MSSSLRTGKTAFVTGGTGFVGSHLVEALLEAGYAEVRCLVRRRLRWLEGLDVVPVEGDLEDEEALREGCRGVDFVYHVAGVTGTKESLGRAAFAAGNVEATERLLRVVEREAPAVQKVLVTSSLAAVGAAPEPVATEETPLNPISLYGRSKAEMERRVRDRAGGLPVVVVRPPAVYGPRDADILTFFQTVNRGVCPIVGRGDTPELSLVHGRDLARGMRAAAESEATHGETYFIGSERPYAWGEIRDAAAEALGRRVLTVRVPEAWIEPIGALVETAGRLVGRHTPLNREKALEIRRAVKMCSSRKAVRDFGYAPSIPLDEGVRETIAWYRAHGWL